MILRAFQQKVKILIENIVKEYFLSKKVLQKRTLFVSAFPGSGKSMLPIIIFKILKEANIVDKLCWVVPRKSLRTQGAKEFVKQDIRNLLETDLEIREIDNAGEHNPSRDTDGFGTTYQAIGAANKVTTKNNLKSSIKDEFKKHRYLLFLDEMHHLTSEAKSKSIYSQTAVNWYNAVKPLFDSCHFCAGVSGTPFRHNDEEKIAFIDYKPVQDGGLSPVFDVEYSYRDAVKDKAVINLHFLPMKLREVSYKLGENRISRTQFEDSNDLFAALNSEYGQQILEDGLNHWQDYKLNTEPRSKCIIVCASQEECRKVAKSVNGRGLAYALAITDEKDAHPNIEKFKNNENCNVLITCQMAYEGLDCIQATHLICLSRIRSLPFLIQMFTRVMRNDRYSKLSYEEQIAYAFVSTDKKMTEALEFVEAKKFVKEPDEIDELFFGGEENKDISKEPPPIEEMKSSAWGVGQKNLDGVNLSADMVHKLKIWQIQNKIKQTEIESFLFLKRRNLLSELDGIKSLDEVKQITEHDFVVKTPRERENDLRMKITKLANKADFKFNLERGTWNKRAFNKFGKGRKEMTESELKDVYAWMKKAILEEANCYK